MNRLIPVAAAAVLVSTTAVASAHPAHDDRALARPDTYSVRGGKTLTVHGAGVLANDKGDLTSVVAHTATAHGTLDLQPDGSFSYTPAAGFRGTDTFQYTTTDAVHLYRTSIPPLATIGGVKITGGAYGSSFTPRPGSKDLFYGLTDRGPNVDGPNGSKVEPITDFVPAIGEFRLQDGKATLIKKIELRAGDGQAYDGQVNCAASTGETILDLDGNTLPCSDTGYDPEGIVALKDGTFWVSDEYGPFITHFAADGRQIGRLSPFDHSLPRELANRVPNKGMEGLTITPDGSTLVGIMQSALQQRDVTAKPANIAPLRIVTVNLKTFVTHEYLYLLDDPKTNGGAVSEIAALSNTSFVVDERDGKFEPNAYKKLFKIDLKGATDVGPANPNYSANAGGVLIGGKTIEGFTQSDDTAKATTDLAGAHITVVKKWLDVDLGALVTSLDPTGGFFGHDKVEGIAPVDGGRTLIVSNDNDFGIDGLADGDTTAPFQLHAKTLPNGRQDDGEYLAIDTTKLPAATTSTTVSILVK